MGLDLLGRLFGMARNRDGQARALEALAQGTGNVFGPRPVSDAERGLQVAVATKLLEGWLANRRQTQIPHILNFRVIAPEDADLLLAVMAAAQQADGEVDAREARQIPLALQRVGAGEAEARRLEAALAEPQHLGLLLERAQEAGLAAHAYAAALLAINRRGRVNRAFLGYAGARLGLAPEAMGSLERRYRA